MKHAELLFLAIGGADPELVARSEKRKKRPWAGYGLAAAACLVLVLALRSIGTPVPDPPTGMAEPNVPVEPALVLPERGRETGALRLLSYAPQSREEGADFLIYVNEEQFSIQEDGGRYCIRSTSPLPEGFPECGLDILHLPGATPAGAREAAEKALGERYTSLTTEEPAEALPGSLYLRADMGADWDAEQAELWFAEDGEGGTFVLASRYFLEAEEGLGRRFRDMVSSFRAVSRNEIVPEWMRSLREAADRLFPALFSNDLSGVSDLLAEGADAEAYGEDVWEYLSIASVDYAPDDDRDPASATVWVKHRLNLEEGESYSYLTMELTRREGQWRLAWSGLEK